MNWKTTDLPFILLNSNTSLRKLFFKNVSLVNSNLLLNKYNRACSLSLVFFVFFFVCFVLSKAWSHLISEIQLGFLPWSIICQELVSSEV